MSSIATMPEETLHSLFSKAMNSICTNCIHAAYCRYRKRSKKTIIQCELHDAGGVGRSVVPLPNNTSPGTLPIAAKGLCANCSKATHCVLQKDVAGVWHCDEYD